MPESVTATGPLVGIVAGEPSGDLLGGALVAVLRGKLAVLFKHS
jgi:lipid A disaccharide synthetase